MFEYYMARDYIARRSYWFIYWTHFISAEIYFGFAGSFIMVDVEY